MNPFRAPNSNEPVGDNQGTWCEPPVWASRKGPFDTVSRRDRVLAASTAIALMFMLVVACLLDPDARGHGTHQQLGFPPCTLMALCGVRCPTCGMTTAWANVVRGRLLDGFAANVGGVLLAFAAIGSIVGLSATAVWGRRPKWFPDMNGFAWGGMVIAAITLIDWAIRILLL